MTTMIDRSSFLRLSFPAALLLALAAGMGLSACGSSGKAEVEAPAPEPEPEPEIVDTDGDGIPDDEDMCPDVAGVPNTDDPTRHGCPERRRDYRARFEKNRLVIDDKIMFETGKATITEESGSLLDEIAETIVEAGRRVNLIEVAGHADERGNKEKNRALTYERAEAVIAALVERGVEAEKLVAKGYGSYCPKEPGNHDLNRRVQFVVLRVRGRATGAETGCEASRAAGIEPVALPPDEERRRPRRRGRRDRREQRDQDEQGGQDDQDE